MLTRRMLPLAASLVIAAVAAPAFAEGSWSSSISGANTGFKTRTWTDANSDDKSTTFGGSDCTYDTMPWYEDRPDNFTTKLIRYDTWSPNENYGNKTITCKGTKFYSVSWGDKGKGKFGLTLTKIDGSEMMGKGRLNVKSVKATY